jgi:hypothetical protein
MRRSTSSISCGIAKPRCRFVYQVYRLVGQEALADVPVRERGRGHDGTVRYAHAVVRFVALLEAAQDRDRVLDRWLAHVNRLEAPFQGRILLYVFSILVERRGADHAQLAASEHRLQHVAGVDGSFSLTGTY